MEGGGRGAEPSWCRCSWATPVGHSACDLRLPRPRHHARADCYRAVARCPLAGVFRGSASAARDTRIAVPVRPRPRLPRAPFRARLRVALRLRCGRFGVVLRASAVLRACRGEEPDPRDCLARRAFSFVEQSLEVVVSAWALGVRAARVRAGRLYAATNMRWTTSPHCHVHRRLEPFGRRSTPSPWRMPAAHSPS